MEEEGGVDHGPYLPAEAKAIALAGGDHSKNILRTGKIFKQEAKHLQQHREANGHAAGVDSNFHLPRVNSHDPFPAGL